ncbi:hypothetical protein RMATCC62417_02769 [Rhizopus microsporus]|nr:hypothetical protein RMATCC62417_02769 [Rhizopus microsporus]
MLTAQEIAWVIYAIFFTALSLALVIRSRHHVLLLPFVLFSILTSIALIAMLSAHYNYILAETWASKSLALNILPVISLLVFLGIMEAQILFIRQVATALNNRERWRSIYLRDSEKQEGFPVRQRKQSLHPWNYWTSITILIIYALVVLCCIILQLLAFRMSSVKTRDLGMAICITILFILSSTNCIVIWNSSASSTIRQNRDDTLFLRCVPVLFSMALAGTCILAWIHYGAFGYPLAAWILIESLLVYLPFILILCMSIHVRKFKSMGRQYPNQYSPKTIREISFVTKRLTAEEVNQKYAYPPPSYYPY